LRGSSAVANSTTRKNCEQDGGERRATLSHLCHQRPFFVTDPGLLVPPLSLLIPFLSLGRAALYKRRRKGEKKFFWGSFACEKENKLLSRNLPAEQQEKSWTKNLGLPCPTHRLNSARIPVRAALAMRMRFCLPPDKSSVSRQVQPRMGLENLEPER
jgi:hypothetical protein